MTDKERIARLEHAVRQLKGALASLIMWTTQSAASPISRQAAEMLLAKVDGKHD